MLGSRTFHGGDNHRFVIAGANHKVDDRNLGAARDAVLAILERWMGAAPKMTDVREVPPDEERPRLRAPL